MRDKSKLYYECHITMEPVFDLDLARATDIVEHEGFRMANLLMQKRKADSPRRSEYDTFCTARDDSYANLETRMYNVVWELQQAGYTVWRYKIEDTILDVRHPDPLLEKPKPRRRLVDYVAGRISTRS